MKIAIVRFFYELSLSHRNFFVTVGVGAERLSNPTRTVRSIVRTESWPGLLGAGTCITRVGTSLKREVRPNFAKNRESAIDFCSPENHESAIEFI